MLTIVYDLWPVLCRCNRYVGCLQASTGKASVLLAAAPAAAILSACSGNLARQDFTDSQAARTPQACSDTPVRQAFNETAACPLCYDRAAARRCCDAASRVRLHIVVVPAPLSRDPELLCQVQA